MKSMPLTPKRALAVLAAAGALAATTVLTSACTSTVDSAAHPASSHPATAPAASTPTAIPGQSSPSSASPSTQAPSGPAPKGCASSALKAKVATSRGSAAAGSAYYPIDFTNISGSSCTMFGYPGVSFVTGRGGRMLGKPATRNSALAPVSVTLAPGAVAHATIQVADAGNYAPSQCKPVTGHWLKIYPPNQFAAIYARFTTQVCSAKLPHSVGSQLGVYVVRPGPGKAGQGP